MSKTPIERAAEALANHNGDPGGASEWIPDARAVFESIDREELVALLLSSPMPEDYKPRSMRYIKRVHEREPGEIADAILALLTGGES